MWVKILILLVFTALLPANPSSAKKDSPEQLKNQLIGIDAALNPTQNIWLKKYIVFEKHNDILKQIERLEQELKTLRMLPKQNEKKIQETLALIETLEKQLELLDVDKDNLFKEFLQKPEIPALPNIRNPFAIISAYDVLKQLDFTKAQMKNRKDTLQKTLNLLEERQNILNKLQDVRSEENQKKILELRSAQNILQTTHEIFDKAYQEVRAKILSQIKAQVSKLMMIMLFIGITLAIAFVCKVLTRRYIEHSERSYLVVKVINFINISVVLLILAFAYLDNASYLVTFLGFASAGLAIAMKDLFMSLLGWCVIIIGGSIHVGDRIRVLKEGIEIIGDVIDISLLKISLYENVTMRSMELNRAGRIIFVPNHYIFTTMIANYTHGGLKTMWDVIEVTLTFDSDLNKAVRLMRNIATSRINAEGIKREFNKLRVKYGMKIPDLTPRIFTLIQDNGVKVSLWYPAGVFGALKLKSEMNLEIIQALLKEPDIHVAYATTRWVENENDGFGNKFAKASKDGNEFKDSRSKKS